MEKQAVETFGTTHGVPLANQELFVYLHPDGQQGILVEPLTWGAIAITIAKAIISWVVQKQLTQMFGGGGVDLAELVKKFEELVRQVVRQELQQRAKEELDSSMRSLQSLLTQYLNNKNPEFLVPLRFKANELAEQMNGLGLPTIAGFATVGTLELAIIQLCIPIEGDRNPEIANIVSRANGLIEDGLTFPGRLNAINTARFGQVLHFSFPIVGDRFAYTIDGQLYTIPPSAFSYGDLQAHYRQAVEYRETHMSNEYSRIEKELLFPLYAVMDAWRKIIREYSLPRG